MGAKSFEELQVWKKAHQVTNGVFDVTLGFPSHQRFVLVPQMQRAAVSIPANIVEGFGRRRPRDKARFYNIAEASANEVQYYFILARDRRFIAGRLPIEFVLGEVQRMLRRLVEMTLEMV
jgi:four helix bundle protein